MDFGSETALRTVDADLCEMILTCRTDDGHVEINVHSDEVYRAYDGRLGLTCSLGDEDGEVVHVPFDAIEKWAFTDPEGELEGVDFPTSGDIDALKGFLESEIKILMHEDERASCGSWDNPARSWSDLVEDERLDRMSADNPGWHRHVEQAIYLTLAASTWKETREDLAIRVGGALWAESRGSNAERVAAAAPLIGLKVPDSVFIAGAEKLKPHEVARVQSSAMFVGLGGDAATPETLRLLTLLQNHSPVPRFF